MVRHIVMWNFKDEIPDDKKPFLKEEMEKGLKSLVGKVPGLLSVEFVKNPIKSSTHDIALVTTLNTPEDVAVYANHPEHVFVANTFVRPYVKDRVCLDY